MDDRRGDRGVFNLGGNMNDLIRLRGKIRDLLEENGYRISYTGYRRSHKDVAELGVAMGDKQYVIEISSNMNLCDNGV